MNFRPGLDLCEDYFHLEVEPILARRFPGLKYTAGRLASGSEVLGFDDERSMDHHWGPRVDLFLSENDLEHRLKEVGGVLAEELPLEFDGFPTRFSSHDDGQPVMDVSGSKQEHGVKLSSLSLAVTSSFGLDPRNRMTPFDWLVLPQQRLLAWTEGRVFHDPEGELSSLRELLSWYPKDVWRYLLASQWFHIGEKEPLMGRANEVGDEIGTMILASNLAEDLVGLALLQERRYKPYKKWLGSSFRRTSDYCLIGPMIQRLLAPASFEDREKGISDALEALAVKQNDLGLCSPLEPKVRAFHSRPYMVLHAHRFAEALHNSIENSEIRAWPIGVGNVDQITDSVALKENPDLLKRLGRFWTGNKGV